MYAEIETVEGCIMCGQCDLFEALCGWYLAYYFKVQAQKIPEFQLAPGTYTFVTIALRFFLS